MSIDRPTTNERQCMEMMRACIKQGVTIAFIREAIDALAPLERKRAVVAPEPEEPGPATGVRRRTPPMKKRSASKAKP